MVMGEDDEYGIATSPPPSMTPAAGASRPRACLRATPAALHTALPGTRETLDGWPPALRLQ